MSQNDDRCPRCGQLEVNCGCIPPRNVSGHDEAKKMEQETAKAMQEAEAEADDDEDARVRRKTLPEEAQDLAQLAASVLGPDEDSAVERLIKEAVVEPRAWEIDPGQIKEFVTSISQAAKDYDAQHQSALEEEEREESRKLTEEALARLGKIMPNAPILFARSSPDIAEIGVTVGPITFVRLRYGGNPRALFLGSAVIHQARHLGQLLQDDVQYAAREVCCKCFGELGWRATVEVRGPIDHWYCAGLGRVQPSVKWERYSIGDKPTTLEFYCLECGDLDPRAKPFVELLPC